MGCGTSNAAAASTNAPVDTGGSLPLMAPNRFKTNKPMSFDGLRAKRAEFWDTRVNNNATTWSTLKMAADALLDKDVDTAQAIIAAADIRTPHGTLELVYDERGGEYRVPQYCWDTPNNLVDDDFARNSSRKAAAEANGAAVSPSGVSWTLTLRVGPGARPDEKVEINSGSTVRMLKEKLVEQAAPVPNESTLDASRMRVMFWGTELKDTDVLKKTRVENNAVVQVFVRPGT